MPAAPRVTLALQGGGAHGAYGWGVVDALLDAVEVVAVSGASAGAMNGAALVTGLSEGGADGARTALERLWRGVSAGSPLALFEAPAWRGSMLDAYFRRSLGMAKLMGKYFAPFTPGVRDMRQLRQVVRDTIDLELLATQTSVPFHVSATDVSTGAARIFTGAEVTCDALMASACLPEMFAAVEIDGKRYWDGGFSANPALEPLIADAGGATDMIVVQVTPFVNDAVGNSVIDMTKRVAEISFNACLLRDLNALTRIQQMLRDDPRYAACAHPELKAIASTNLHMIGAPDALGTLGSGSKVDTRWSALQRLYELGRETGAGWLAEHRQLLGRDSTLLTPIEADVAGEGE